MKVKCKLKDVIHATTGLWEGSKETGVAYEWRIRKGWQKRKVPYSIQTPY